METNRFYRDGAILAESLRDYESVKKNDGILTGSPIVEEGPNGKCLKLSAITEYISYPNHSKYTITGSSSLSAWIKVSTNDVAKSVATKYDDALGREWILRLNEDEQLTFFLYDETTTTARIGAYSTEHLSAGWHNVVITYDGTGVWTGIKLYSDNVLLTANQSDAGSFISSSNKATTLKIGVSTNNGVAFQPFLNDIKDVLIFNRVLSTTEIADLYKGTTFNYDNYLINHWDMSDINPQDLKGTNNGIGSNFTSASIVTGYKRKALSFSQAGFNYVDVGSHAFPSGCTMTAWIFPTGYGGAGLGRIFDENPSSSALSWAVWSGTSTKNNMRFSSDAAGFVSGVSESLKLNNWYHVAAVRTTNGSVTLYRNGSIDGVEGNGGVILPQAGSLWIGNRPSKTVTFDGYIGDIKVYNQPLTALQMRDIYEREK